MNLPIKSILLNLRDKSKENIRTKYKNCKKY